MEMRHGPPDLAATTCRHERARDKIFVIVGARMTDGRQHIRFRWTVGANDGNVRFQIEVTGKRRTADRPYTS